jgi:adenylate cyclase
MSYTIIGDAVNTASRLTQMAKAGEVLISGAVYDAVRAALPARGVAARGDIALRGKAEATAVYAVQLAEPDGA